MLYVNFLSDYGGFFQPEGELFNFFDIISYQTSFPIVKVIFMAKIGNLS